MKKNRPAIKTISLSISLIFYLWLSPAHGQIVNECENWQTEHPEWIFCDDFESGEPMVKEGRYFEYGNNGGDFVPVEGLGLDSSIGMRTIFQKGEVGAGGMKLGFGRNPQGYMNKGIRTSEDFREVYYRMYMKLDPEWEGNPAKLSRATVFTSTSQGDWSQAMIAHLWSDGKYHLLIDPASGISNGEVITTKYNDFDNLIWLGNKSGTTPIFDGNHDEWLCIEHHVKLNDPGEKNGIQEFWINGNLEARKTGLDFVGTYTAYAINAIFFENYWNTGSVKTQERYWDNIVVSTEPIGCLDLSTASDLKKLPKAVSVYPNPTKGQIMFDGGSHSIQHIKISDITGKTLFIQENVLQKGTIDLSSFTNGIYLLSIITDKDLFTIKIVKH